MGARCLAPAMRSPYCVERELTKLHTSEVHLRSSPRVAFVVIALALAACTRDHSAAPVEARATVAANWSPSGTCDFWATKADAHFYFASSWDPIFSIIYHMQSAYAAGGAPAATEKGFDALQRIADARGTSAQSGTAANGDALTKDLLACMSVGILPSGFSVVSALSSGVFEVRGASNGAPALAYTASPAHKTAASPVWGVEAPWGWAATFHDAPTRFLVYGAPRPVSTFTNEHPSTDPTTNAALTGFDISTIPSMPGLSLVGNSPRLTQVLVGICIAPGAGGSQPINRLLHGTSSNSILALTTPGFCNSATASSQPTGASAILALIRAGAALFTPRPLEASALLIGGVGGLASGLSPFGPVVFGTDDVGLSYVQQPTDGRISAPISPAVTVRALTAAGTPIAGVEITLSIVRNHGKPAGIVDGTGVATTNDSGIATFASLQLTKAGGYLLEASGSLGGGETKTVVSHLFNVKGK